MMCDAHFTLQDFQRCLERVDRYYLLAKYRRQNSRLNRLQVASSRRSVTFALLFFARSTLFALRPNELNAWAKVNRKRREVHSRRNNCSVLISAIAFSKGRHEKLSCKISLLVVSRFSYLITVQFIHDLPD